MNRRQFLGAASAAGAVSLFDAGLFAAALTDGEKAKTLVLGGGAFALGYALARPARTLVLERGIHLAADFSLAGDPGAPGTPSTPLGKELLSALEACGIVRDGNLEPAPLADFMAEFFAAHGGKSFMAAELVDVEKGVDGWTVSIFGGGTGADEFAVGDILDTTDAGWRNSGADLIASKRFSAVTDKGHYAVDLPATADWREARLKLYEAADAGGRLPDGSKLLAETGVLKCLYRGTRVVRQTAAGFPWVPSMQFGSFIESFEEGVKWSV